LRRSLDANRAYARRDQSDDGTKAGFNLVRDARTRSSRSARRQSTA
jgi:hypothetical protein